MKPSNLSQPTRTLGKSGIAVSALGLGCWPIAGPMFLFGKADSYGDVDDDESVRAIHAAMDAGVTFFDTADCYGAGHSETVLGRALLGRRARVVLATKFGYTFDPATKNIHGEDVSPGYIRRACRESLRRLQTDHIDLLQVHCWQVPDEGVEPMADTLDALCAEGVIRAYGWSTDDPRQVRGIAARPHCAVVQHEFNVFTPATELLRLCRAFHLGSLARSPLAMGLLSGRYSAASHFDAGNVRGSGMEWLKFFRDGRPAPEFLRQLDAIRDLLASGGRSLVQGAIGYLWAKSDISVPIPGFRTTAQAVENAAALAHGPLDATTVAAIDARLHASSARAPA